MKQDFYDYIGAADSLNNYARSYKLIYLKSLFDNMNSDGVANAYAVANDFKNFYLERKQNGKVPDVNVEPRIANIENSSINDVLSVILNNPYKVISKREFVTFKQDKDESKFIVNSNLHAELTKKDYEKIDEILNEKIRLYYSRIDKNDLNFLFATVLKEYYNCRTTQIFAGNSMGNVFKRLIVEYLKALPFIDPNIYIIKGSIGQGNWANVPWVSIYDKRITTSAIEGVYIVYLLSEDGEILYLTLNQGVTKLIKKIGRRKALEELQKKAKLIRESISSRNFIPRSDLILGNKFYEKGCIFYKEYSIETLPDNNSLVSDIKNMVEIYQEYYKLFEQNGEIEKVDDSDDDIDDYESEVMEINIQEEVSRISKYISSKGFTYKPRLIENMYLCLKSKPFLILAGTSGTGKTKLVKLFAESIGSTANNKRYKLVPVRPDWSDSTDIFGHLDLNGKYQNGAIIEFVRIAISDKNNPYFLCLDEMNLARVEYYFSDILSILETRHFSNGSIVTDKLIPVEAFGQDNTAAEKYSNLYIPENLYIIGTVNMDETTFPFSKKVLDRANTIEISNIDLDLPEDSLLEVDAYELDNSFLRSEYLQASDCIGLIMFYLHIKLDIRIEKL